MTKHTCRFNANFKLQILDSDCASRSWRKLKLHGSYIWHIFIKLDIAIGIWLYLFRSKKYPMMNKLIS